MAGIGFETLAWWLVIYFLIHFAILTIISYRRLCHVPGPTLWALTRLPLIRAHLSRTYEVYYGRLCEQYGKLVRIGPNYLVTSDPEIVRRMNPPRSLYIKSNWYFASRFSPGIDNMISERDERIHELMRKKAAPAYSGKDNPQLEQDVDECIVDFVRLIKDKYLTIHERQPIKMELARKIHGKFHDLRDDKDHFGYLEEVESLFPSIFCTSVLPELMHFLTATGVLSLFDLGKNAKFAIGKVHQLVKAQVDARLDTNGRSKGTYGDMLGSFVKHGMTKQELEQEEIIYLVAGSDTSATAIRATMLCLMRNKMAYGRFMYEIDQALHSGRSPKGDEEVISDEQAKELPYLQAVIKEVPHPRRFDDEWLSLTYSKGLRWLPPTGGILAKQVPAKGVTIEGHLVPGGTIVGIPQYALHHSTELFGPDPLSFRPERWLHTSMGGDESSLDKIKAMERNNELIFGCGKCSCLGKSIAFLELNKTFVKLLRRFEFTVVDPENPWSRACYGIHIINGLWVTVRERERPAGIVGTGLSALN